MLEEKFYDNTYFWEYISVYNAIFSKRKVIGAAFPKILGYFFRKSIFFNENTVAMFIFIYFHTTTLYQDQLKCFAYYNFLLINVLL